MPYSPEERERLMNAVCERMERGESIREACRNVDVPRSTIMRWGDEGDETGQYARACDRLIAARLDELEDIVDAPAADAVAVADKRLRAEQRRWELSKVARKTFGDRTQHEVGGKDGGPIETVTRIELVPVEPEPRDG